MTTQLPSQALSSSGEETILKETEQDEEDVGERTGSWEDWYEIDRILSEVKKLNCKKVALQFPDGLLKDAQRVVWRLQTSSEGVPPPPQYFVLADTSYGACCVDQVAASHIEPDLVVHFGRACLSKNVSIPTLYILPKRPLEEAQIDQIIETFSAAEIPEAPIVVFYDLHYHWIADMFISRFAAKSKHSLGRLQVNLETDRSLPHKSVHLPEGVSSLDPCIVFWLGGDSRALRNFVLTHSRNPIYSVDPVTMRMTRQSTANKMLARRYVKMQQTRDGGTLGIVMGTLGVESYLDLVNDLIKYIKDSGRKCHLFAMGKLNPAKMANFTEIDAWVLIGCPENTLIDSKEFYRPIVSPFECVVALSAEVSNVETLVWDGSYTLDFGEIIRLLDRKPGHIPKTLREEAHFSVVTGKYTSRTSGDFSIEEAAGQLTIRDTDRSLARLQGNPYLENRTFQGLDVQAGTAVGDIEHGRSGLASSYDSVNVKHV